MGCSFLSGRPGSAPTLHTEGGKKMFHLARWADVERDDSQLDVMIVDCHLRGLPHQRPKQRILSVHCDKVLLQEDWATPLGVVMEDGEAPEENDPSRLDPRDVGMGVLPHTEPDHAWRLFRHLPEALEETPEARDGLVEHGWRLGSACDGRGPIPERPHCINSKLVTQPAASGAGGVGPR